MSERKYRVAMMFAGDPSIRATVKLEETRLGNIAKALRDVGLDVEAASYADEVADEVRDQLLGVDGVLVWVDPIRKDGNRAKLDPILRDVANHGVFVSSHPDLILKMGTKEVLYRTRNMSAPFENTENTMNSVAVSTADRAVDRMVLLSAGQRPTRILP
jgi:hypothetical protein